jgi:chromosomal replication initiation ATPase DnaA
MEITDIPQIYIKKFLTRELREKIVNQYLIDINVKKDNGLLKYILDLFGIKFKEIVYKKQNIEVVTVKQLFCYFAKKETKLTPKQITQTVFLDRTSIYHAIKTVLNDLEYDYKFEMNGLTYRELFEKIRDRNI